MLIQPCRLTTYTPFDRTLTSYALAGILAAGWFVPLPASAEISHPTHELSVADQAQAMADALQGKAYQDGASVPQNYAEAARLYRSSASKGWALGQYYLGFLYVAGLGVPRALPANRGTRTRRCCSACCITTGKAWNGVIKRRSTGSIWQRCKDGPTRSIVSA